MNEEPDNAPRAPVKSDSNGFLSSILTAAHNAANIISSSATSNTVATPDTKKDHSFSHKLDFLLKPAKLGSTSKSFLSEEGEPKPAESENSDPVQEQSQHPLHLTANVQFESVRESPLNSLGQGDLSLDAFAKNRNIKSRRLMITPNHSSDNINDLRKSMSPDRVNRSLPSTSQLMVSGAADSKRVHRKSIGNGSIVPNIPGTPIDESKRSSNDLKNKVSKSDASDSDSDIDSDASDTEELDGIIDYSQLKFASKKRNKEFHRTFKKLPQSEKLIHDCSCALSKDILVQGRMYISEHYVCFNSNILGWVTNITIPLQEVILIEKKSTAVLFPNGMIVRTLHHKYVFATFLSRDATFDLITNIWHRVLLEGADVDTTKLFKTNSGVRRKRNGSKSTVVSKSLSNETLDDSDEYSSGNSSQDDQMHLNEVDEEDDDQNDDSEADDGSLNFKGFPVVGPLTHDPTEFDYQKQPNDTFITEETLKAPLGAIFLILFGNDTSKFILILKKQKNFDISELDITGLGAKNKERNYTYIKPLAGPIGPKQTKCLIEDKLVEFLPEKYILVEQVTQTPDVPSGNSFKVRTKIYLSWGPGNTTKIYVVTAVEWSGKSWIKGAIEKGSIDGQKDSMKVMVEALNEMIRNGNSGDSKSKSKSKKKSRSRKNTTSQPRSTEPKEEKPEAGPAAEGIQQQFSNLVVSIGKLVPIPYLGDMVTGIIVLLAGLVLFVKLANSVTGHGSLDNGIQYLGGDGYVSSKIRINNRKYLIIPTISPSLNNKEMTMEAEVNLWNWVRERSDNRLHIESDEAGGSDKVHQKYSDQELREIVRLAQMKLDRLSQRLDI
ncbi:uncharacterized protein CANTADRAFT_55631 [Suhomyces tanzawaensis NRRL Y-17324]|uniref:VASt domain-containing protein n=1 Tax=Suhomyces tanzawaensis NRRL Y-17324 TaxID=984487 RepID=A0A1E4SDC4_9ASCO|nr:uncharacterized protein CANTADRAFT_55631 [Suhomyces tanzawaensis NRRL Y-17324]ODV77521.1 hypothetical protein CANTADRAFT_55631 [Suhomyces tanzawaensis NRRL Y-17324]